MSCLILLNDNSKPFLAGDSVTGTVICTIKTPEEIKGIIIKLRGRERVYWYQNKKAYSSSNKFLKKDIRLLSAGRLEPGLYTYSFSFVLPLGIPTSYHGQYGWVTYMLKARVIRRLRLNYKHKIPIPVISPTELEKLTDPTVWQPITADGERTVCCLCCMGGSISMEASLEKTAFVPGESINVRVKVNNWSNVEVRSVKVEYCLIVTSRVRSLALFGDDEKSHTTTVAEMRDVGLGPRDQKHYEIPLTLPMFDAVPNFSTSDILSFKSGLAVTCVLSWMHCNLRIWIPTHLADISVGGKDQYYARLQNTNWRKAGYGEIFRIMGKF